MRRMPVLAVFVGLGSGLLGVSALSQLSAVSGPSPTPGVLPVLEQNLDDGGFIRVHEQGTVPVTGSVVVGNLPGVQNVNVTNTALPAARGRVIEIPVGAFLGENHDDSVTSADVDTSDCRSLVVTTGSPIFDSVSLVLMAPNGHASDPVGGTRVGGLFTYFTLGGAPLVAPRVAVQVTFAGPGNLTVSTVWIFCGA